ncbi:MAG: carbamoyltransferase N-terminal domain-containing protein [Pyrinomonadaceae bacterium]
MISMNILGISAYYHDSAACLVRDGEIVAAAQEERFTRKKHDHRFPLSAIEFCLRQAGITEAELAHVVFYDKPLLKFERLLETYIDYAPHGWRSFLRAMPLWLREKLWTREQVARHCDYKGKVLFTEHHEAHAASAFFPSPFDRAAVLTIDGVGEWATSSYGYGRGNELHLVAEQHFPHSLGLLYSAFTYYLGFRVNSGEYKVMGLAPYGAPRYVRQILSELVDLRDDGSMRLNMKYFNYAQGLTMTNRRFDELFGAPPRAAEGALTQREMDLARSVQEVTEEAMLRMARHVGRETGERNLCLAGGVALNCVGNGRILREGVFDDIWIQPAAGDAGGALGAALSVWHQHLGNERVVVRTPGGRRTDGMSGSDLGPSFDSDEVRAFLDTTGARYRRVPRAQLTEAVARLLAEEGRWLVSRADGVWTARPRQPEHTGGPALAGDAVPNEFED